MYFIYFNYTGLPTKDDTALQRRSLTLKLRRFQGYTSHGMDQSQFEFEPDRPLISALVTLAINFHDGEARPFTVSGLS